MLRTYTPGFAKTKAILVLCGLALLAMGILQIRSPLVAAISGVRASAIVLRVERTNVAGEISVFTTTQAIPVDESRADVFRYWVEIDLPHGAPRQVRLAIANRYRPAYLVGDNVRICYSDSAPEIIYGLYEWSTWILGIYLLVLGLAFTGAFLHLYLFARTSTPIPIDTPQDVSV